MDLDSDSDSSKPDMRDDLADSESSSNAQGSSLGAERMGMQVRSSSSEDGSSPLESAHGMASDYDSATEADAAGNRLLRSSGRVRKQALQGSTARMPAFGSCSGNRSGRSW